MDQQRDYPELLAPAAKLSRPRGTSRGRPAARGFTLMELLVVATIIALLVAILMPTLGRAKAFSQRTTCQANLKGIGLSYAMYAQVYDNYVPTGNRNNAVNENYRIIVSGTRWYAQGLVFREGFINDPKTLFCPSQQNTFFTPLGQTLFVGYNVPSGGQLRSGYSNYYAPDWTGTSPPAPAGNCSTASGLPFAKSAGRKLYKIEDLTPAVRQNGTIVGPQGAFFSEDLNDYSFADMTHIQGINVLYVDWTVSWLPRNQVGLGGYSLNYYTSPTVYPGGNVFLNAAAQQAILELATQLH